MLDDVEACLVKQHETLWSVMTAELSAKAVVYVWSVFQHRLTFTWIWRCVGFVKFSMSKQ